MIYKNVVQYINVLIKTLENLFNLVNLKRARKLNLIKNS